MTTPLLPARDIPNREHGITLFYTTGTAVEDLTGTKLLEVYGGELIIFWHEIEPEEGAFDWSRLDRDFEAWQAVGKKLDIRLSTAHISPVYTPRWVFENHHVRRVGRGIFEDFEGDRWRYSHGDLASVTTEPAQVFTGSRALLVHNSSALATAFLSQDGPPLDAATLYSVQWDYLPIGSARIVVEVITESGEVLQRREVHPDRAGWNVGTAEFELEDRPGQHIRLLAAPGDHFAVDNVNIIRTSPTAPFHATDMQADEIRDWIVAEGGDPYWGEAFRPILSNNPAHFPLRRDDGLQIRLEVDATIEGELRCVVRSRSDHGRVLHDATMPVSVAEGQRLSFHVPALLPDDDQEVVILYRGPGSFQIREAAWRRWTDFVTVFPDYFSDDFNRLWERLVAAFADRYRDHPALGIVSVGGFGRWEEVMLDDDAYGALDRQWLSRGFTQERYLDQVVHCMDLFRQLFPETPLRICLAYGLRMVNDVDWIYRRTSQAAIARGIGLKQNGLSEKYDTWDSNTNTSYLYHLYRHDESISLTHETGGQIFRNSVDAHGYPLSLLNRTAANYTDYLFLYFNDIHGRHIRKYFHTHLEQARRTRPTSFYSWLGDTTIIHEHRSVPVATQNRWFGLRQFDGPGQTPVKSTIDGEQVMRTSASNRRIVFDVDDRFQYHGMFGAELGIEYYDAPAGPFHVEVHDNTSHGWRTLGTVTRTGNSEFRRAFFQDDQWNRSARHGGEDVHADLILWEPSGTAPLAVRNVELHFVPAMDWKMRLLTPPTGAERGILASPSLSVPFSTPLGDAPPRMARITLHAPGLGRSTVVGRVYGVGREFGRERLLAEKEFYLPADRDQFHLPFTPSLDLVGYRVELTTLEGQAGWYEDESGQPAVELLGYEPQPREDSPVGFAPLEPGAAIEGTLVSDHPLQEVRLVFRKAAPDAQVNIRIRRELPGMGWSAPLIDLRRHAVGGLDTLAIPIEPQTAGQFHIEVQGHWAQAEVGITHEGILLITPVHLLPRHPDRAPHPVPFGTLRRALQSETEWRILSGLEPRVAAGSPVYRVVDFEPGIEFPLHLDANVRQRLVIRLRNSTGSHMARIHWAAPGEPYRPENSILLPLVPNDSQMRDHPFPLGLEPGWRGHIERIRLTPVVGMTRHGEVELSALFVDEDRTLTELVLARPEDNLVPVRGIDSVEKTEEGLLVTVGEEDAILRVPLQDLNIETAPDLGGEEIVLRVRNDSSADRLRVLWHTPHSRFLNPSRAFERDDHPFLEIPIQSNDITVREYRIALSRHPEWRGHVVALGIAPAMGARAGEQVLIESLVITDSHPIGD